jgi:hypothetical protein
LSPPTVPSACPVQNGVGAFTNVERSAERTKPGEIEIVDQESHRRVRGLALVLGVFADTTDLEIARPRGATTPCEVRNLIGEIAEVPDISRSKRRLVVDGHARRDTIER